MLNNAQHWHSRTPLRVCMLGLLFFVLVIALLGLLWHNWGYSLWLFAPIAMGLLAALVYTLWHQPISTLSFDEQHGFGLASSLVTGPIRIYHVWYSPFAISLSLDDGIKKQQLVFWRWALCPVAWRQLHIHLLRYQLQYQFADSKGT